MPHNVNRLYYVEPEHPFYDRDRLWNLGVAVRNLHLQELSYYKAYAEDGGVKRIIEAEALGKEIMMLLLSRERRWKC